MRNINRRRKPINQNIIINIKGKKDKVGVKFIDIKVSLGPKACKAKVEQELIKLLVSKLVRLL